MVNAWKRERSESNCYLVNHDGTTVTPIHPGCWNRRERRHENTWARATQCYQYDHYWIRELLTSKWWDGFQMTQRDSLVGEEENVEATCAVYRVTAWVRLRLSWKGRKDDVGYPIYLIYTTLSGLYKWPCLLVRVQCRFSCPVVYSNIHNKCKHCTPHVYVTT